MAKKVKEGEVDPIVEKIKEVATEEIEHQHPDAIVRPACTTNGPISSYIDVVYLNCVLDSFKQ